MSYIVIPHHLWSNDPYSFKHSSEIFILIHLACGIFDWDHCVEDIEYIGKSGEV